MGACESRSSYKGKAMIGYDKRRQDRLSIASPPFGSPRKNAGQIFTCFLASKQPPNLFGL